MSDYKPLQFWRPGAGGAGGGRGRVCLCACAARVGVRVCGCVRPDAGYMSGGLPSVLDLTLGKEGVCRVPDQGHSANLVFFSFSLFSFFSITYFSKFIPMYFENTLSNSLNNIYLIFL